MARDKTDKIPDAAPATREEILEALAPLVRDLLDNEKRKPDAMPGWVLHKKYGVRMLRLESGALTVFSDEALIQILIDAKTDAEAFDLACRAVADRVLVNAPLPDNARVFASSVLTGVRKRPKSGRGHSKGALLRILQYLLCCSVRDEYGLPLTQNDQPSPYRDREPLSACGLVADAFTAAGKRTTSEALRRLCAHKDFAKHRQVADYYSRVSGAA